VVKYDDAWTAALTEAQFNEQNAEPYVQTYLYALLQNTAVSGVALAIGWQTLYPQTYTFPPPPSPDFTPINDAFQAVANFNHDFGTSKTISLIIPPGMASPSWVWSQLDVDLAGPDASLGAASCDPLFLADGSPYVASPNCAYTNIFYATDNPSVTVGQLTLPMPWNGNYMSLWEAFLQQLANDVASTPLDSGGNYDGPYTYPSSLLVSIDLAGPTGSSTEMILPNNLNQTFDGGPDSGLSLSEASVAQWDGASAAPPASADSIWTVLQTNYAGTGVDATPGKDWTFTTAWDGVYQPYHDIFKDAGLGITLVLVTTTDGLPFARANVDATAPGFASDCVVTEGSVAMNCAAVTDVLDYVEYWKTCKPETAFATQEDGLTAGRANSPGNGGDLGENGPKWLALASADASWFPGVQAAGGLMIDNAVCDDPVAYGLLPGEDAASGTGPGGAFSPEQGIYNVLGVYFEGTPYAGNFSNVVSGAPFSTTPSPYPQPLSRGAGEGWRSPRERHALGPRWRCSRERRRREASERSAIRS
jgi:hypothetical protein